ncbi:MAG: tRNA (adenosine(37)-N6)-threonylcarbamoyltransferase complex ATPase subunit type 1 TsaE [Muribaculaceae bacterium]|nr:tRNA (adenosine(37)-N6)-threonylcarbamoyltransferase complex ATPase subunit type 1 TsaE [Muribaculaceae bacterium]
MQFKAKDLSELPAMADAFIEVAGADRIFAFNGAMGAGKTTLISEICRRLGAEEDELVSPTFSIVNEYTAADGTPIYHFDFYRIDDMRDALDLGLEEYFESGGWCFMEWPEKVAPLLPEETVEVTIEELPDSSRLLSL